MRRIDDTPIDPEVAAQLAAIDATVAGEPVDPRHADVAELALLLVAGRPTASPEFTRGLDARVERRFARPEGRRETTDGPAVGGRLGSGRAPTGRRRRRPWLQGLAGLAVVAVAGILALVVLGSPGASPVGGGHPGSLLPATARGTASTPSASAPANTGAGSAAAGGAAAAGSVASGAATGSGASAAGGGSANQVPRAASAPQPVPNGRKVVQSAQLALSAPSERIDQVAQELFDVVGRENGYVNSSNVTAGSGGYAEFQLSIPSAALATTMTELSDLPYARVASRTDATQDVNGEYLSDVRQLADARALRTALLGQLARASTQAEIDSLNARIRDAEASIRSDQSTLNSLNHSINYSHVIVTVNAAAVPVAPAHRSSGAFTLARAAHDAGRVLTVAAGGALIALAALVPVGLIAALLWWVRTRVQRRRREQALDLA